MRKYNIYLKAFIGYEKKINKMATGKDYRDSITIKYLLNILLLLLFLLRPLKTINNSVLFIYYS